MLRLSQRWRGTRSAATLGAKAKRVLLVRMALARCPPTEGLKPKGKTTAEPLQFPLKAEQCIEWIGKGGNHAAPHAVGVGAKNNRTLEHSRPFRQSCSFTWASSLAFAHQRFWVLGSLLDSEVQVKLPQTLSFLHLGGGKPGQFRQGRYYRSATSRT